MRYTIQNSVVYYFLNRTLNMSTHIVNAVFNQSVRYFINNPISFISNPIL